MRKELITCLEKNLQENQIPYMEILTSKEKDLDLVIKVYYPEMIKKICRSLDEKFILKNKKSILIKKDNKGYPYTTLSFLYKEKVVALKINSLLQNTWGIV